MPDARITCPGDPGIPSQPFVEYQRLATENLRPMEMRLLLCVMRNRWVAHESHRIFKAQHVQANETAVLRSSQRFDRMQP